MPPIRLGLGLGLGLGSFVNSHASVSSPGSRNELGSRNLDPNSMALRSLDSDRNLVAHYQDCAIVLVAVGS